MAIALDSVNRDLFSCFLYVHCVGFECRQQFCHGCLTYLIKVHTNSRAFMLTFSFPFHSNHKHQLATTFPQSIVFFHFFFPQPNGDSAHICFCICYVTVRFPSRRQNTMDFLLSILLFWMICDMFNGCWIIVLCRTFDLAFNNAIDFIHTI